VKEDGEEEERGKVQVPTSKLGFSKGGEGCIRLVLARQPEPDTGLQLPTALPDRL